MMVVLNFRKSLKKSYLASQVTSRMDLRYFAWQEWLLYVQEWLFPEIAFYPCQHNLSTQNRIGTVQ